MNFGITSNHPETTKPATRLVFNKVGENLYLYRLESSGGYYALLKRGGKQIRRSLKTTDAALARRRLHELRAKVARLNQTLGAGKITFDELAQRWLVNASVNLKPSSISRLDICLKGLSRFFAASPFATSPAAVARIG